MPPQGVLSFIKLLIFLIKQDIKHAIYLNKGIFIFNHLEEYQINQ